MASKQLRGFGFEQEGINKTQIIVCFSLKNNIYWDCSLIHNLTQPWVSPYEVKHHSVCYDSPLNGKQTKHEHLFLDFLCYRNDQN